MAVIELERQVTRAALVVELFVDVERSDARSALLASAAGAEGLTDEPGPTDAELIAAYDAHTRPLDTSDLL